MTCLPDVFRCFFFFSFLFFWAWRVLLYILRDLPNVSHMRCGLSGWPSSSWRSLQRENQTSAAVKTHLRTHWGAGALFSYWDYYIQNDLIIIVKWYWQRFRGALLFTSGTLFLLCKLPRQHTRPAGLQPRWSRSGWGGDRLHCSLLTVLP